jgi:hypothetical protein
MPHEVAMKTRSIFPIVIMLVAAGIYLVAVVKMSVNFPWWDDYDAILAPMLNLSAATSLADQFKIIWAQHNEHRIVFGKLVAYGLNLIEGKGDLRAIVFVGNLGLITLCATLIAGAWRTNRSLMVLALVPLIMLTPMNGSHSLFAMACLGNYWVLAFAALSLYFLVIPGRATFIAAIVFALMAVFTSGQGVIGIIPGFTGLLIQRRRRDAMIWAGFFMCVGLLYFVGYKRPGQHPPMESLFRAAIFFFTIIGAPVSDLLLRLLNPFRDLFGIEGYAVVMFRGMCGLSVIGACIYLWVKQYYKKNIFVSLLAFYLILLCAAAALSRSGLGLSLALDSRYFVISLALASCVIIALCDHAMVQPCEHRRLFASGIILWLFAWCLYYPDMHKFSGNLAECQRIFVNNQAPEAVVWGMKNEKRGYGYEILWRSYFSGYFPVKNLLSTSQNVKCPLSVLSNIATEAEGGREPSILTGKPVCCFIEESGQLILVSANNAELRRTGSIWLENNTIYYSLNKHDKSNN